MSEIPNLKLQEIPLNIALKAGDIFCFDCYIKLPNGKMVKVCQAEGQEMLNTFEKYKAKGVTTFYASKQDLVSFLKTYQQTFSQKVFDPGTVQKEKVETLSSSFDILKDTFINLKMDALAIEAAEATAKDSLRFILNVPNLFNFFKTFKANCSDEFMNSMMVNYISSMILDQYDWSSSEVKKKLAVAVLLADITLTKEDIVLLRQYEDSDPSKLPEHILNHPTTIAEIIRNSVHYGVPSEVAQIIEQHHELPLKAGFPNQLDTSRVTLFSAVQIISYYFIKEISAHNFDFNRLDLVILAMNSRFNKGNYGKVMKTLLTVITT